MGCMGGTVTVVLGTWFHTGRSVLTRMQEASEDSVDEEGYHDAPAVYVGGQPAALDPGDTPTCLRCRGAMAYVGRVDSDVFSDELQEDRAIHLFYCHDCRLQCCLDAPSLDSTPLVELDLR